jgi:hypothetical protein
MSILQRGARGGAATFVVGFSLAWPQALGIASADSPDQDSSSVSAGPAKSGTPATGRSARATHRNATKSVTAPDGASATSGATSTTRVGSARSAATAVAGRTVPTRSEHTTGPARRVPCGRATEDAVAEAVRSAIGNRQPDPASTAGTTTESATVVTVTTTTTPTVVRAAYTASVPATPDKISSLAVPRANDVLSSIIDFFSGLVGSFQSLVEGVGLLVRCAFFNQAPTVDPVQTTGQTGGAITGSAPDGQVDWNFGYSWALGNSVGANQYDFEPTAMHELLHTFGFLSVVDSAGNNTGTNWTTFDQFVVTDNGTDMPIDHTTYSWISTYNTDLTGGIGPNGGLYFGGPNAKAANGGQPVPLYTPNPWKSGSSMSHLDDSTFTGANAKLMNAVTDTGLGIRILSPVEVGILKDLGYNVADPRQTLAIFVIGFAFIRRRRRSDGYCAG